MARPTFLLLAAALFVLATIAIGIRGLENWEVHELVFYYALLGWGVYADYLRRFSPVTG